MAHGVLTYELLLARHQVLQKVDGDVVVRRQVSLPVDREERVNLPFGLVLAGEGVHVDELRLHVDDVGN